MSGFPSKKDSPRKDLSGKQSLNLGARFNANTEDLVQNYTSSIKTDIQLAQYDLDGSRAHVRMLTKQGIIQKSDAESILKGLDQIESEILSDTFTLDDALEDIHMHIENRLEEISGPDIAGKLHTARSRNDQVTLDTRMFVRDAISKITTEIRNLQNVLLDFADRHSAAYLPGYTHLQRAQPILLSHQLLAYFEMLDRDAERFLDALKRTNIMPLGSAALAGSPYPIDREMVARELNFETISKNSMDAVSDRDYIVEFLSVSAICMVHISRICEDLILWSSTEFGFLQLDDRYTTGSSIMPQKRNPDIAELARGKSGRVIGHLMGILVTIKGLPLSYNRDLQEDKPGLFDSVETLITTLTILRHGLSTARFDEKRAHSAVDQDPYILATDYADFLARRNVPFREAHQAVGALVSLCEQKGKSLSELSLEELQSIHTLFDESAVGMTVNDALASRDVYGGTAPVRVKEALAEARSRITLVNHEDKTDYDRNT